jgi:peptide chain release factor 2
VATYQNERSYLRNKETALKVLRSHLLSLELDKKAEEQTRLRGNISPLAGEIRFGAMCFTPTRWAETTAQAV